MPRVGFCVLTGQSVFDFATDAQRPRSFWHVDRIQSCLFRHHIQELPELRVRVLHFKTKVRSRMSLVFPHQDSSLPMPGWSNALKSQPVKNTAIPVRKSAMPISNGPSVKPLFCSSRAIHLPKRQYSGWPVNTAKPRHYPFLPTSSVELSTPC